MNLKVDYQPNTISIEFQISSYYYYRFSLFNLWETNFQTNSELTWTAETIETTFLKKKSNF